MKKIILTITSMVICLSLLAPSLTAFAQTNENQPEWEDMVLTEEEFNDIIGNGQTHSVDPYTAGLILLYNMSITGDGNKLYIGGQTRAISSVVKCGFKKIVIQRKTSSSTTWSDYLTYENIYQDTYLCVLTKSITVPTGYQYRVTCIHYAKKNIFSTEKINNTSNIVTI